MLPSSEVELSSSLLYFEFAVPTRFERVVLPEVIFWNTLNREGSLALFSVVVSFSSISIIWLDCSSCGFGFSSWILFPFVLSHSLSVFFFFDFFLCFFCWFSAIFFFLAFLFLCIFLWFSRLFLDTTAIFANPVSSISISLSLSLSFSDCRSNFLFFIVSLHLSFNSENEIFVLWSSCSFSYSSTNTLCYWIK